MGHAPLPLSGVIVAGGKARINDDESVEVGWFVPATLPPLPPHQDRCLTLALDDYAEPWFATPGGAGRA